MSQPFDAVAPSTNGQALSNPLAPYHAALASFSAFPGLNSFTQALTAQSQMSLSTPTEQVFPQPQPPSPSNNSDIEKLERLKREILKGQNPIYKALPQPSFLESLYLGRSTQARNSVPAHPDQIVAGPSASSGPQTLPETRPDADSKASASDHSSKGSHTGEDINAETKLSHSPTVQQDSNGDSRNVEGNNLLRSSSSPQSEPKPSETYQHRSNASGVTIQDAMSSYSNGTVDNTKQGRSPVQSAIFPSSEYVSLQTSIDPQDSRGPFNNPAITKDPPYDPKESLRSLNTDWSADRNRHSADLYDPASADIRYTNRMENIRDGLKDGARAWNNRPDYRYDEAHHIFSDYHGRHPSTISGADSRDAPFHEFKHRDDECFQEGRKDFDVRRLASSLSGSALRPVDSHALQNSSSDGQGLQSNNGESPPKVANGVDQARFTPSAATSSMNLQSTSAEVHLTRTTPPAPRIYAQPIDEKPRMGDRSGLQSVNYRSRQPSMNDDPTQIVGSNEVPGLGEPIGHRTPPVLEERVGIRIPLEQRITSPPMDRPAQSTPALEDRIGDRPSLGGRISTRETFSEPRASEPSRPGDLRSIPTPLSLIRPRHTDEKLVSSSLSSVSTSAQATQQKVEDKSIHSSPDDVERNGLLQRRLPLNGVDPHSPQRGIPLESHNARFSPNEDFVHRGRVFGRSDARMPSATTYPDESDRRMGNGGRSFIDVGHYERPTLLERNVAAFEDRARPSLESREWRERDAHTKSYATRSETHPLSSSPPRVWSTSVRNGRPFEPSSDDKDKDRYFEYGYDHRTNFSPRTWDRNDANRMRPPPEVYPPPSDIDRERFVEFREKSRIRGRSPSPNPLRRSTYGGPMGDLRPAKRVRDETYPDDRERHYSEHYPRPVPPPPSTAGSYYDTRAPDVPRDAYPDRNRHSDITYYDRRAADMGPPRLSPYAGRAIYSRPDLDRFNGLPPRTA